MCRWMAWFGQPVLIEEVLFKTQHGIVDQSLHARMGAEPTNGDGFGLGWYGSGEGPAVYHSVAPAWGDAEPARAGGAHRVAAVPRPRARGDRLAGAADQLPSLPPRAMAVRPQRLHRRLPRARRDLMLAIDPALFADVHGSTDTEVVFYLALTFGLEEDPIAALERTVGFIEATARSHGVDDPVQGSFGISDGTSLWAVRYATKGRPRSLFASADVDSIRRLHPDNARVRRLSHDDRVIVSEPFADLPGAWHEIPPASAVTVRRGGVLEHQPFQPQPNAAHVVSA